MEIPIEFKIFGTTITVELDNDYCDGEGVFGMARHSIDRITLSDNVIENNTRTILPPVAKEISYLHEVIHVILRHTRLHKELENKKIDVEKFVDLMSRALHQVFQTSIYDEKTNIKDASKE